MSEIPEVTSAMLTDSKLMAMLSKYPDAIDSIHFSDQYTGVKPPEDQTPAELPEGKKVLIFTFNITGIRDKQSIDDSAEAMKPLMLLVLYFIDKVKRFRLSREAKNSAYLARPKIRLRKTEARLLNSFGSPFMLQGPNGLKRNVNANVAS